MKSIEGYLEETRGPQPKSCFKAGYGRSDQKRWLVYTEGLSHAFLWSHLIEFTLNADFTEAVLYLSNHEIVVRGKNLQPLQEALMKENLEHIGVSDERELVPLKENAVAIDSIRILEPKSPLK